MQQQEQQQQQQQQQLPGKPCDFNGLTCFATTTKYQAKYECTNCGWGPTWIDKRNWVCAVCWASTLRRKGDGEPCTGRECARLVADELFERSQAMGSTYGSTPPGLPGLGPPEVSAFSPEVAEQMEAPTANPQADAEVTDLKKIMMDNQRKLDKLMEQNDLLMVEFQKLRVKLHRMAPSGGDSSSGSRAATLTSSPDGESWTNVNEA